MKKVAEGGAAEVNEFSWDNVLDKLLNAHRTVLEKPR